MTDLERELIELYHTARIALDNPSRYERMRWAADEYIKKYPSASRNFIWLTLSDATRLTREVVV